MKPIRVLMIAFLFFTCSMLNAQNIQKWKIKDLESAIKNAKKPTIFNFWATYCVPCMKELPHFQQLVNEYKKRGVTLILVSLDISDAYPKKIRSFINSHHIKAPVAFLDESNADAFCPLVDVQWSGAIPATLFINNQTGYRKFIEDELTKEKFESELKALLGQKK